MSFWTFICVIILIGVAGDALKKAFQGFQSGKKSSSDRQYIAELTRRINELEKRSDLEEFERRLQALEAIVVDSDYILNMKFKRAMG